MQFFSSSQQAWSNSQLPQVVEFRPASAKGPRKNEPRGWYDSSFDLAQGLEVTEQDNDTLYQLWELSQN